VIVRLPSPLLVATHNLGKLAEWRTLLAGHDLRTPETREGPDETESTYHGNALIKARDAFVRSGLPSLADDTGFEVDTLGGAPGVDTAPWAAKHGGYPAALSALMQRARPGSRARLVCALALVDGEGETVVEARIEGTLRATATDAPGFAALLEPDDGPLVVDGVLAHRRAALAALIACR
jgi:XTP/dITP diphosphohydrolase